MIETAERVARVDELLAEWRKHSAYVLLLSTGEAKAAPAGQLRALLEIVRRDPSAQLIELADPRAREFFIAWALGPKGRKAD